MATLSWQPRSTKLHF